jgi:hypothetical protein
MNEQNLLLDALTRRGVLLSVSVRYWRARKKLHPEDLGLIRDQVDESLISLGHKRLVSRDSLRELAMIESRAHALVEENSFPFLNGVARYVPNPRLAEVTAKLRVLQTRFEELRDGFIAGYADLREQALRRWADAARAMVDDPQRLVAVVAQSFPPVDRIPGCFGFDVRLFQVAVPEVPDAELVDLGTRQELIETRREACLAARTEIENSCREFIGDCAAALRSETAKLCGEMLETLRTSGSVHQKTLNRLVTFIDRFSDLNFVNDTEMEAQLQAVREEFLRRSAAEYRDSAHARGQLMTGLTALRERAAELAREDPSGLVGTFGRMGHRRFTLAA